MKRILFAFVMLLLISCEEDCTYDQGLIARNVIKIEELKEKQKESETLKDYYQEEIDKLEKENYEEYHKCD